MTDFSSVEHLERAFDDARRECSKLHEGFLEAYSQLKALQTENDILQKRFEDLRTAQTDLNSTHNSLMADSLTKIEEISDFPGFPSNLNPNLNPPGPVQKNIINLLPPV